MENFKQSIINFYKEIVKNKKYYLPLLLLCIVSYGFDIVNRTVSIDDLSFSMFGYPNYMAIGGYRWGLCLLNIFLYTKEYTPFIGRFFALLFLLIDAVLLSFIFYSLNKENKNVWIYTILSIMFCTYPLINELWYCTGLNVPIAYNGVSFYFIFVFLSIIYQLYAKEFSLKTVLIAGLIATPAMAGYESVMFAYVSLVFIILYIKNKSQEKYPWFIEGLKFAAPLVVAVILKYAIGYLLILIVQPTSSGAGNASIKWGDDPKESLIQILYNGWYYVIRGLSYLPIGEFVVAVIIFIVFVIRDRIKGYKNSIILGLFLLISLFALSLLQGEYFHYRNAQTIQLFVSFVAYMVLERSTNCKKIFNCLLVFLLFASLRQSIYLHEILALNNQRSDNEAYIARSIGYRLYSEFDTSKTVIFCGEYQLGSFIEDQITVKEDSLAGKIEESIRNLMGHDLERKYDEFVCTDVNSYFNTQMDAFNGQVMLQKYLSYYGFDIKALENLTDEEEDKLKGYYEKIAVEEGMQPYDIKDMGDYILVYLGPTIDGYSKLEY